MAEKHSIVKCKLRIQREKSQNCGEKSKLPFIIIITLKADFHKNNYGWRDKKYVGNVCIFLPEKWRIVNLHFVKLHLDFNEVKLFNKGYVKNNLRPQWSLLWCRLVDHTPLFENHYSRMTEHEMPEANEINAVGKKGSKDMHQSTQTSLTSRSPLTPVPVLASQSVGTFPQAEL